MALLPVLESMMKRIYPKISNSLMIALGLIVIAATIAVGLFAFPALISIIGLTASIVIVAMSTLIAIALLVSLSLWLKNSFELESKSLITENIDFDMNKSPTVSQSLTAVAEKVISNDLTDDDDIDEGELLEEEYESLYQKFLEAEKEKESLLEEQRSLLEENKFLKEKGKSHKKINRFIRKKLSPLEQQYSQIREHLNNCYKTIDLENNYIKLHGHDESVTKKIDGLEKERINLLAQCDEIQKEIKLIKDKVKKMQAAHQAKFKTEDNSSNTVTLQS